VDLLDSGKRCRLKKKITSRNDKLKQQPCHTRKLPAVLNMKVAPQPATMEDNPKKVHKPGSIAAKAAEAAEKAAAANKPKVKPKPKAPPDLYGNLLKELLLSPEHSWRGLESNLQVAKDTYVRAIAQGAEPTGQSGRKSPKRLRSPQKALAEQLGSEALPERAGTAPQHFRQLVEPGCHRSAVYFREEAQAGNAHAQFSLADCFIVGDGLGTNPEAARPWFEKAAAQNFAPAQCRLGTLLIKGVGGPTDFFAGYDLWQKAAAAGDETAERNLERFEAAVAAADFA
jgi:TPR repeat protein